MGALEIELGVFGVLIAIIFYAYLADRVANRHIQPKLARNVDSKTDHK